MNAWGRREITRTWDIMQSFQKLSPVHTGQSDREEQAPRRIKEAMHISTLSHSETALREQPVRHWKRWMLSNKKERT